MPEDGPQAFGHIEGDGVVATELDAAVVQILPQKRLGFGSAVGLVEKRSQQIVGPQRVAMLGPVEAGVELGRGAELRLGRLVLGEREIRTANRFPNLGLDIEMAVEPASEL